MDIANQVLETLRAFFSTARTGGAIRGVDQAVKALGGTSLVAVVSIWRSVGASRRALRWVRRTLLVALGLAVWRVAAPFVGDWIAAGIQARTDAAEARPY